jgi:hypothetical protein
LASASRTSRIRAKEVLLNIATADRLEPIVIIMCGTCSATFHWLGLVDHEAVLFGRACDRLCRFRSAQRHQDDQGRKA